MLHRIRLAMQAGGFEKKFEGRVEVDETFIGGQARFMHKHKRDRVMKGKKAGRAHLTTVIGAIRRGKDGEPSQAAASVVPSTRREHVMPFVREHVHAEQAILYTDALRSYEQSGNWRGSNPEFDHKLIDHAIAYVQGDVHTNTTENFWALVKRMLKGTYVSTEPFHLFRYLDEQVFRFNNRKKTDAMRFMLGLKGIINKRLTYTALIGSELPQT
jgi:transposase-like protein